MTCEPVFNEESDMVHSFGDETSPHLVVGLFVHNS